MSLREKLNQTVEKAPCLGKALTREVSIKELGIAAIGTCMAFINAIPSLAAEAPRILGNLDLLAYYDGGTRKTEPYSEVWIMKPFPHGLTGEFYAETMAQEGNITGAYAELIGYYDIGQHFKLPGLAPWLEYVVITGSDDFARGGLMWSGSPWKNSFLILRAGYADNMEGNNATARIIFNQNLPHGSSIGGLINSQSIADGHIHAEIPRLYFGLNEHVGLTAEATYDRSESGGGVNNTFGVRGGVRVKF